MFTFKYFILTIVIVVVVFSKSNNNNDIVYILPPLSTIVDILYTLKSFLFKIFIELKNE